jgi:nicotinamide-nucleotide amidase
VVDVSDLVASLAQRRETVAVAESLTGGLLVAELIRPAGASAVVVGGIVAYNSDIKESLLGVDPLLLRSVGPVHPDVASAMARNVRRALAVDGRPATMGVSTTGVAGPDAQGGQEPGVVFLGLSWGESVATRRLDLTGSRDDIRALSVQHALEWIAETLERGLVDFRE